MEKIKNRILILSLIIAFFSCETEEINFYEEQQRTHDIRPESDCLSNTENNDYEGFSVCKTCSEGYNINNFSIDTLSPKRTGDQADDHGNPEDGDDDKKPKPKRTADQADDHGNAEDGDKKRLIICKICNKKLKIRPNA